MFPESLRSLYALTLHRQGDTRRAAELWHESGAAARRSFEARAEGYAAPMELAAISAIEGHTGEALDWLERGYRAGWKDARLLSLDPFVASARREPRYLALTAGMRQEVAEMRKRGGGGAPLAVHPAVGAAALIEGPPDSHGPGTLEGSRTGNERFELRKDF